MSALADCGVDEVVNSPTNMTQIAAGALLVQPAGRVKRVFDRGLCR